MKNKIICYIKSCWTIIVLMVCSPLLLSSYDPCSNNPNTIRNAIKISAIELAVIVFGNITGLWWVCFLLFLFCIFGGAFIIADFNEDTYQKEE